MIVARKTPELRHKTDPHEKGLSGETGIGKTAEEVTDPFLMRLWAKEGE
jgi:hypothetical protein